MTPNFINSSSDTARAWFDQFPLEGIGENSQWCARHWAPCPLSGGNGAALTIKMISIFLEEYITATSPEGINRELYAMGRLCCTLGDDRMYELWGKFPPPSLQ